MVAPHDYSAGPSLDYIGRRIREAIETADDPRYRGRPDAVAVDLGIHRDTLDRYMKGEASKGERGGVGAITIWKIAKMTGKRFSWFAGVPDADDNERLVSSVETLEQRVTDLRAELDRFLGEVQAALSDTVKAKPRPKTGANNR